MTNVRKMCAQVAVCLSLAMLAAGVPASAAVMPPFDQLPTGPAPTSVPYAIGTRIFYQGQIFVVPSTSGSTTNLVRVQPYHGNVLTSVYRSGSVDYQGYAGLIGPTSAWHVIPGYIDLPADSTLAGQLLRVTDRDVAQVVDTSTGAIVYQTPVGGGVFGDAKTVGAKVLIHRSGYGTPEDDVIWDPPTGAVTLLGATRYLVAQRRSPGWLWRESGGGCFALVTLSAPTATGTRFCHDSIAPPLLSFDGTIAITVRAGRLVAVSVASGQVLSTGSMGAISGTGRSVQPVQWETSSAYLAHATWDGQLALVRCHVSDGQCERVVRSYVRGTIRGIVVGW